MTCKFKKHVFDAKVVFNSSKQISGLFFVPSQAASKYKTADYVKLDSFSEREIMVGSGQWILPGTLTLPKNHGPFPAVVLVHGAGPHDRDESIGPNKPFRDLAHGLATKGIAVLRYEKRTKAFPLQMAALMNTLTVKEETIDDVLTAVAMLRKTDNIDTSRIFVLGHSLGGYIIPRIGKLDSKITGFVIMAGSVRPLEDMALEQLSYIFSLDGIITDSEKISLEKLKVQVAKVKNSELSPYTPATELPLGVPAAYWLDLRRYQPAEMAKDISRPMLIIQGGRDYQVTEADFQLWKKTLSLQENVEFKLYKKLNHLFVEGEDISTPAEYEISGHIAEKVIEDITIWIKKSYNSN